MSRLYHPSFFGARINVSTKEFLLNPSFNANLFFQTIWVFKPDKNRQNQTCGSGRRGYEMWSKFDGKRAALHPHLSDEKFGLHGLLDSQGGEQRRRNRSDLILNKAAKIIVSALTISDSLLSISGRMEFSVLKWSDFSYRNFKMFGLCRLFHSSSFGASIPVSIKEFLWDLSFHAKLYF